MKKDALEFERGRLLAFNTDLEHYEYKKAANLCKLLIDELEKIIQQK